MDFPKKQAQRLMPLYLLEYSEKLFTNHPNPEDPWGGGSDYTAGQGITITNNEISVDTNVIATKADIPSLDGYATETWVQNQGYATSSEIPTNYVTTDTAQTITGLKTIGQTDGTISEVDFSGFTFKLSNKAINHPEADIKIWNSSYDGYQHPNICSTKGLYVNLAKIKLGDDGSNTYGIRMPDSSTWEADRVLATTADIPTLATVATTGSYNDLIDKPNLLPIINMTEAFTFTATGTHEPPYKWGENMACTSTWICYGSVEALPQIYLQHWFALDECYAYPQYMWQDPEGYHAVYSTELVQDNTGASGARIVLNAPQLGVTWTSVSTYPVYGKDKVNNGTITITQGGTTKGSFTVNQLQDQTIALDATVTASAITSALGYTPGTSNLTIGTTSSTAAAGNHTHSLLHHDLGVFIENTTTDKGWSMFNDTYNGFLFKSVRFNANSPDWGVGNFGAGVVFGGADTKGVMSVSYRDPQIKFAGGPGNEVRWWIGLTGTSGTTYDLDSIATKQSKKVTGSWSVSTTNPGPMVDIILAHPDIKIYYKTYTSNTRKTDISSVLFNASHNDKQGIYSLVLRYINASGNLTTISNGTIYYEYFD